MLPGFVMEACCIACGSRTALLTGKDVITRETEKASEAGSGAAAGGVPGVGGMPASADAGPVQPIYVADDTGLLSRFVPSNASFTPVGHIECWPDAGTIPSAMAVDRSGTIYLVYGDTRAGYRADRVDAANASCGQSVVSSQIASINPNGMAFSADPSGRGETLYGLVLDSRTFAELVSIDVGTFAANPIAELFNPATQVGDGYPPQGSITQLTGSGLGDLFEIGLGQGLAPSYVLNRVDRATGILTTITVGDVSGDVMTAIPAAAAAYWGGDIYVFGMGRPLRDASEVIRIGLGSRSAAHVGRYPGAIVRAAVPTTAPAR